MNIKAVCVLTLLFLLTLAYSAIAQAPTFLIFFDYGNSDTTFVSTRIVEQVMQFIESQPGSRVEVIGHNDTTENADISLERARNVAMKLVTLGLPSDRIIDVTGVGDSEPLVPTEKGVREPQNRFVQINVLQRDQGE